MNPSIPALLLLALSALPAAAKPNVIFILVDDMGWGDYGPFFQNQRAEKGDRSEPWFATPQLDRMAAEGLQLPDHYCPAPVCAPSRASLLLGVHQGHSPIRNNQFDKELPDNHTLATVMRGAGYATAAIGKWGLQGGPGEAQTEAWNAATPAEWPGYPTKRGFDFFHGYVRHRDGHRHYPKEDGKQVWENDREISADLDRCFTVDLFTARAKKWIVDHREASSEQPFFLYLAHDTPHAILQLASTAWPEGGGLDGGVQWTGEKGRMINTATGEPDSYLHPNYADATWDHDRDPRTAEVPWPDVQRRYASLMRRIDDGVGDLLDLLGDLGIDDNTLVIFTTDNGPSRESYLPERYDPDFFNGFGPFDGIKRDVLEGGVRVGALARWPGKIETGAIDKLPSQFHDWLPTFAELGGVPAPANADGVSLVPTLTGEGEPPVPRVYVEYFQAGKTPDYADFHPSHRGLGRGEMQMIRKGEMVGVRFDIESHDQPFRIHDISADPQQVNDLAADRPDLQREMRDEVLRLRRPNPTAKRPYDDHPVPALDPGAATPGVRWQAHAGGDPWLARLDDLEPVTSGTAAVLEPVGAAGSSAIMFSGFIEIEKAGNYEFTLPAGRTALLRIHQATVIDRGFGPAAEATTGSIRLAAGRHPFRLYWLAPAEKDEALLISGPGLDRQPIPAAMLSHAP